MFAVMGATGNTGSVVAKRLLAAGSKVRAIGRSAERLRSLVEHGAEPAVGDALDEGFLTRTFDGMKGVYAMVPPDYADPDPRAYYRRAGASIAGALQRARVGRVVFLSSLGAELPEGTGPIAGLHDVEERLKTLGVDLMILRPGYFYENFYGSLPLIRHQGVNGGAIAPEAGIPMTATADIGAAAAEELLHGDFKGVEIRELRGPRDYTMTEVTRVIGESIGKPDLKYIKFADADFANALLQSGFSRGVANSFVEMSHALSAGKVRPHQPRSPRTTMPTAFESFAERLAEAYRAG